MATWRHQGIGLSYAGEVLKVRTCRQIRGGEHTEKHEGQKQRQARGGNSGGQLNTAMPEQGVLPLCGDAETAGKWKVFQIYNKILLCTQVQQVALRGEAEAGWRGTGEEHYHRPPGEAAGKPDLWGWTLHIPGGRKYRLTVKSSWISPGPFSVVAKRGFFHVVCLQMHFHNCCVVNKILLPVRCGPQAKSVGFLWFWVWTVDERSRFYYRKNGA